MVEILKPDSGFIVLNKPQGMTSQKAVSWVKRRLGFKKAGHTGTLDPLATGVLPIALGEATKAIPYLDESLKIYRVTGRLGESTDTYDREGKILETRPVHVDLQELRKVLHKFEGWSEQKPPVFSALKLQGKPLYRYARAGQNPEVAARRVHISCLELLDWTSPFFSIEVHCSRGTYIRSLVHDVGQLLGCGAHVTELHRVRTGPFEESQACSFSLFQEEGLWRGEGWRSIPDCLTELPEINLSDANEVEGIKYGRFPPSLEGKNYEGLRFLLKGQGRLLAILFQDPHKGLRLERVFRVGPEGETRPGEN